MNKINIVIPMAGAGSRFKQEGYKEPKPFIKINGKMMIERVLDGLKYPQAKYSLIMQKSFLTDNHKEVEHLKNNYDISVVTVEKLTQGASCTALAAHETINNNTPVMFADSDNIFSSESITRFIEQAMNKSLDGSLLSFKSNKDIFSFVELNEDGFALRTKEKEAISDNALAGVYYFQKGSDFVKNAIDMMIYNDKDKGEFYMSNVYNYLIKHNKKINIYTIQETDWDCVGTPAQLEDYLKLN